MKEFTNITEAVTYHKKCYVCGSGLKSNYRDEQVRVEPDGYKGPTLQINLSSGVDSDTDDFLTINMITNVVELRSERRSHNYDEFSATIHSHSAQQYFGAYTLAHKRNFGSTFNRYNGTLYEGMD